MNGKQTQAMESLVGFAEHVMEEVFSRDVQKAMEEEERFAAAGELDPLSREMFALLR